MATPTPSPVKPAARTPVWLWSLMGLLMVGASVGAVVWANKTKRTSDPIPLDIPSPKTAPTQNVTRIEDVPEVVPPKLPEKKVDFFKPEPLRQDFGLKVVLVGSQEGKAGVPEIKEDSDLVYEITTEVDAFVTIWNLNPDGSATQIFPLADKSPSLFKAGDKRLAPVDLIFTASVLGKEPERVYVLASTHGWSLPGEAKTNGKILELPSEGDPDRWEKIGRAVLLQSARKADGSKVAETVFRYQVAPK